MEGCAATRLTPPVAVGVPVAAAIGGAGNGPSLWAGAGAGGRHSRCGARGACAGGGGVGGLCPSLRRGWRGVVQGVVAVARGP